MRISSVYYLGFVAVMHLCGISMPYAAALKHGIRKRKRKWNTETETETESVKEGSKRSI